MTYAEYGTAADLGPNIEDVMDKSADARWPEPMPLVRPMGEPAAFPVEALGPVLENAARGIEDIVQCPLALAGCSVLAAASLAAQAHVDVVFPATGRAIPTSLFILTIAESGERKSAADTEALAAVKAYEAGLCAEYRTAFTSYRDAQEAWEAARATVKKKAKGGDWQMLYNQLQEVGDEPNAPRKPHVIVSEPTFEGLAKLYAEGQPSLGLFSAEGGSFIGGHAMREEGRLRALTGLSELWDGSPLRRTRAGDGSMHLAGRRLAVHLMTQPNVAPMLLADPMASGQGFLSRLLVCAPTSTQGTRFQRTHQTWARPSIDEYSKALSDMLHRKPRLTEEGGLNPLPLALTDVAMMRWRDFADEMELGLSSDGLASSIRGLRNKTPEMALRIAGVLAAVDEASEITPQFLDRGIALGTYFLSEAKRLYEASSLKPEVSRALKLLRWLLERNATTISLRDIQQMGPASLREASVVKETVATLEEHGLCQVEVVSTGGRESKRLALSPFAASAI